MPKIVIACLPLFFGLTLFSCGSEPTSTDPAPPPVAETTPPEAEAPPLPPPAHSPDEAVERLHQGIDVSVHSGRVDWDLVIAKGHGFAILKATEGVDLEDGAFAEHWRAVARVGLVRGAYHFYVTEDDPHEQADWFISKVQLQPGDLAPILDIELVGHNTEEGWQENVVTFARRLHDHYGVRPIIYTSPKFWQTHFSGELAEGFAENPLWIAEYGVEAPNIPSQWATWHMWQFQGDAEIEGVEKGADLSRVNREAMDPVALQALLVPAPESSGETPASPPTG